MTLTNTFHRAVVRVVAGPLAAVMLSLSVAVPLLEVASAAARTVLENPHPPGSCPSAHDHTICVQVGANQGMAASPPRARSLPVLFRAAAPAADAASAVPTLLTGPPSRAPPAPVAI